MKGVNIFSYANTIYKKSRSKLIERLFILVKVKLSND